MSDRRFDGCFLKNAAALRRMFSDHPERMAWWPAIEGERGRELGIATGKHHPGAGLFRADRDDYATISEYVRRNPRFPGLDLDPEDDGLDPFVACEACGV